VQAADLEALMPSLRQGGYVIVLRHGATDASQNDVYPLDYSNPAKQRQLSGAGKDTAREVGASLKALGIPIGDVVTSRLDRAAETGRLIAGREGTPDVLLNDSSMGSTSAMAGSSASGNARFAGALKKHAATMPRAGTNTLIVTHKTNIQDAFGKSFADVKEGEAIVFEPGKAGHAKVVARVQPADWKRLASAR
jgi:histidine phosphatase superfamily protein (branch 1)